MQIKSGFYCNTTGKGYYYFDVARERTWDTIRTERYENEEVARGKFLELMKVVSKSVNEVIEELEKGTVDLKYNCKT